MKQIHIIILALLACLPWIDCNAQAGKLAQQTLSNTAAKISGTPCITADFSATFADGQKSSGKLTISRQRFVMRGADYGVWYDGENLWSYYESTGEASVSIPTASELMEINPFDIINHYQQLYTAKLVSSSANKRIIELESTSKRSSIVQATLTIDSTTWLPVEVSTKFRNGASVKIAITGTATSNAAPAQAFFTFPAKEYPNAEIVDLR